MRPPILQWKVSLCLLVVVIAGASLGSALHSDGTPRGYIRLDDVTVPFHSLYIYTHPLPNKMTPKMWHHFCLKSKEMLRAHPEGRAARELLKVRAQVACHHRR